MSSLLPPSQSTEQMPTLSLNHSEFVFEQALTQSDKPVSSLLLVVVVVI